MRIRETNQNSNTCIAALNIIHCATNLTSLHFSWILVKNVTNYKVSGS